jgi:hypothetical protein
MNKFRDKNISVWVTFLSGQPVCTYVEEGRKISPMFIMSLSCISRQGDAVLFEKEWRSTLPLRSIFYERLMHVSHARFTW